MLFGLLGIVLQADAVNAEPPYNVLVISYDTLRADHLSLYGYERDTSPNLDAIGEQSVVFESAIAQSSSTFPSHMSLFQSRYASTTSTAAPMLAEVLRSAGYATAAFTGGGNLAGKFGFDRGFDRYDEIRQLSGLVELMPMFESWLRAQPERPFFAFLHTYDIHHPYDPPAPFDSMFFGDYEGSITGKRTGNLLNKIRRIHHFAEDTTEVSLSDDDRKKIVALYDGGVRYADQYLGQIQALLHELGLWDNTIVVFLSDHGEEFWEHKQVLHSFTVFQEAIHVPLVIKMPKQQRAGLRIEQQVRLMDVSPTLLDLLDIPIPESMLGQSLRSVIDAPQDNERSAVSEMSDYRAYLTPPHKLIVDASDRRLLLFDLSSDPTEQNDLSEQNRDRARQLYRELAEELRDLSSHSVDGIAKDLPEDEELMEQLRALGYLE